MSYRSELVQVAAVAIAAIQNFDCGSTELNEEDHSGFEEMDSIFEGVRNERQNQEDTWGSQNHQPEHWLTILSEETGEVARAILEKEF